MPRRSGFAKKIDTVHWTLISEVFVDQAAGTAGVTALAAQHLPETLMRIRGEWMATFAAAPADGSGVSVTCGLILVPEGTGTTVLWSPISDGDAPWIWWDSFGLLWQEPSADVTMSGEASGARRVIDSKAMRKVRNRELQLVVENATVTGRTAATIDAVLMARVLSGS